MKRIIVLCSILLLLVPFAVVAQHIVYCEGNFDCDQDVDGSDASLFKYDFGRSGLRYPCPVLDDCPNPWAPCPEGMVVCNNACVDPMQDREHFGADSNCIGGTVCGDGQKCDGGICTLTCQPGLTDCNGVCVDIETNENHCGGCDSPCASGEICIAGSCEIYCSDNYAPVQMTGQSTCYNTNGILRDCAETGEDCLTSTIIFPQRQL